MDLNARRLLEIIALQEENAALKVEIALLKQELAPLPQLAVAVIQFREPDLITATTYATYHKTSEERQAFVDRLQTLDSAALESFYKELVAREQQVRSLHHWNPPFVHRDCMWRFLTNTWPEYLTSHMLKQIEPRVPLTSGGEVAIVKLRILDDRLRAVQRAINEAPPLADDEAAAK